MPELFVIYAYGPKYSKMYMRLDDDCSPVWSDEKDLATRMEKSVAGLWFRVLRVEEPNTVVGIEKA